MNAVQLSKTLETHSNGIDTMREKLTTFLKKHLSGKLQQDVIWNMASFGVMGVGVILLNVLIGLFYDAATLGIFNQVFAAYIFFSQFAALGLHYSTLKYVAQYSTDRKTCGTIMTASFGVAIALSFVITVVFWVSRGAIGELLESPEVSVGIGYATVGLFFFALNKVLLAIHNGLRHMKIYAVMQALRPILAIISLAVAAALSAPGESLAVVFSITEAVLFIALIPTLVGLFRISSARDLYRWMRDHLVFGAKSFMGGVLSELNTRVDVLMLGYFMTDQIVGIYSLAAILAEGAFQLMVVLRTNINPILVTLIAEHRLDELKSLARKTKRIAWALAICVGGVLVGLFPIGVRIVYNGAEGTEFMKSWPLLAILMCGVTLSAGYIPLGNILLQAGRSGLHTIMISICVLFNVAANLALIPLWGASGAAIATAMSFVFFMGLVRLLTWRAVGIKI